MEHRYVLEPYKGMNTRYHCPDCQQRNKTFTRYIDTETGEHIHPSVGRCSRESNCGYHYTPKQYFQDNNISFDTPQPKQRISTKCNTIKKVVSFIPVEIFKASLKSHETNNFVKFLIDLFGVEVTSQLISKYFIGTSKYQFRNREFPDYKSETGANVFWEIDTQGKVRTGKIMLYSPTTGKRIKEPFNHINWVHKVIKQPEFELKQCLFGEHLLHDKTKPVAIVESEKTAVIASVYLPQFIWLAVGSLTNLNAERCSVLRGRTVTLFPDLNGFEKWNNKAKELSHLTIFTVSDLLERKATEAEKKQGFDLADYLIKFDYKEFLPETIEPETIEPELIEPETLETIEPETVELETIVHETIEPLVEVKQIVQTNYFSKSETPKPENWEQDITELETYFTGITLPTQPVKLNPYSTITNVSLFIESHFATVKFNNGNRTYLPYLNRLHELKQYLTININ